MSNTENDIMVCRCKQISKNTIVDAIKNGADTYDKVKAETGANAYGCMGCRIQVSKLIEINKK
ncbi:(2Fe-2S)-binding protein [uncultured Clostridium sp.]|uniref:(2Fe-2S)-binding protein n=1 Tax=uncultured Clostridium sp. TaxID=59620 RepID=UPI0026212484|nr:(2Fe-2S)-binding protein [uncultured Clostridium sp.]